MSAIKLHVIKPSVNNMTARVFVRAAKLDFTEDDVYGKTRTRRVSRRRIPAHLTPMMESAGSAEGRACGRAARSCSISATSIISTSSIRPSRKSARWSTARCSISSARSIPISCARPMARWASRNIRAKSAPATPSAAEKEKAQKAAVEAVGETLDAFHKFFLDGKTFVGGDHPSIADIRLAATLEFLKVIDYHLPEWAKTYMAAHREGARRRLHRAGGRRSRLHQLGALGGLRAEASGCWRRDMGPRVKPGDDDGCGTGELDKLRHPRA